MKKPAVYFKIAPKMALFKLLTYKSFKPLKPGQRVKISIGSKKTTGLAVEEDLSAGRLKTAKKIKEILDQDEISPLVPPPRIRWLKWMSDYYHYPMGLAAELSFIQKPDFKKQNPILEKNKLKTQKNNSSLSQKEQRENSLYKVGFKKELEENSLYKASFKKEGLAGPTINKAGQVLLPSLKLTPEQKYCVDKILKSKGFCVHLIHGVTGSGKTEVYKKLIARALNQGLQALVLLPEIFLTPQIVKRFSDSFPHQTALLHSQITIKQKKQVWRSLFEREKNLLVGTRSALFCPLPRLGLIIIDEEHDSSFKQEDKFRYHARDSAIMLAKELNIPIVLGSATPDFSSYKKALDGSYRLYELKKRAFKQALPQVTVVDLKENFTKEKPFWLSTPLFEKMQESLQKGRQVALFLNRRGQAGALICFQCGHVKKCANCDISLTLHGGAYLLCHYCSYMEKKEPHCPSCGQTSWLERGLGTQAVQKELEKYFPDFKILRADRDSISSKEEMEQFIEIIEKKQAQIIIGTQMISKGLNFPSIYLVGLILADIGFNRPDFRAEEKTFQTLLQMAGRAGRMGGGEVALQTFNPQHPSILFAKNHDYKGFFHSTIKSRKQWLYPPFSRLCLLRIDSLKQEEGKSFAKDIAQKAKELSPKGIIVLGPSPAPLMKIKNRYRFQILIKGASPRLLDDFLKALFLKIKKKSFAQIKVDRDPLSML